MENKPWYKKGTPAQRRVWESMRGLKNEKAPNWRGDNVSVNMVHKWMNANFGRPHVCEMYDACSGESKHYDWALRKGCTYKKRRDHFLRLCKKCHTVYDWSETRTEHLLKNVPWRKHKTQLTPDQVREIRALLKEGKVRKKEIAKMFDRSYRTLDEIERRLIWKNI